MKLARRLMNIHSYAISHKTEGASKSTFNGIIYFDIWTFPRHIPRSVEFRQKNGLANYITRQYVSIKGEQHWQKETISVSINVNLKMKK